MRYIQVHKICLQGCGASKMRSICTQDMSTGLRSIEDAEHMYTRYGYRVAEHRRCGAYVHKICLQGCGASKMRSICTQDRFTNSAEHRRCGAEHVYKRVMRLSTRTRYTNIFFNVQETFLKPFILRKPKVKKNLTTGV